MTAQDILKKAKLDKSFWGIRIIAAEKRKSFLVDDQIQSGGWQTCACGKQDKRIPRGFLHVPEDTELADKGYDFYWDVIENRFLAAAETLIAIEKRARIVLRDLLPKKKKAKQGTKK